MTPDDEVVAEHNGETATARRAARAQLSRNVEDGGATVENANVYSLDQLIGGGCGSSTRRPRVVFNSRLRKFFPRYVDRFVDKTHRRLRRSSLLTTPTTVDASRARDWAHEVYYTSVDRNALTPLFRLMVDLLCNLFLQGYSS